MQEGTVFFPNEPIARVTAPLPQAQLVETRLINLLQFQTLIASKAARSVLVAEGKATWSILVYGGRMGQRPAYWRRVPATWPGLPDRRPSWRNPCIRSSGVWHHGSFIHSGSFS